MTDDKALFCKLNNLGNADKDSPVTKKHIPVITVPPVLKTGEFYDVKITVGELEHPNENDHFIQWIEFDQALCTLANEDDETGICTWDDFTASISATLLIPEITTSEPLDILLVRSPAPCDQVN